MVLAATYEIETILNSDLIKGIENEEVEEYCPTIKCIQKNYKYPYNFYCYNYALERTNNKIRKQYTSVIKSCVDGYIFLEECFKPLPIEEAKSGDIITYHEITDFNSKYEKPCSCNCLHFAVIYRTDGTLKGTIIKSTWGNNGVFKTAIEDVPDMYGNAIIMWRKL